MEDARNYEWTKTGRERRNDLKNGENVLDIKSEEIHFGRSRSRELEEYSQFGKQELDEDFVTYHAERNRDSGLDFGLLV